MSFWKNISEFTKEVIAPALSSSDDEAHEDERNDDMARRMGGRSAEDAGENGIDGREANPHRTQYEQEGSLPMWHKDEHLIPKHQNHEHHEAENGWSEHQRDIPDGFLEDEGLEHPLVRRQAMVLHQDKDAVEESQDPQRSGPHEKDIATTTPILEHTQTNGNSDQSAANAPEEGGEDASDPSPNKSPQKSTENTASDPSSTITKFLSFLLTESTNPLKDKTIYTASNSDESELVDIVLQFIQQYRMINRLVQTQSHKQKVKSEEYQELMEHHKGIIQEQQDQINQISQHYQNELNKYSDALQAAQQEKEHLEKTIESHKHKFSQQKRSLSQMSLDAQEEIEYFKQELQQEHEKNEKLNTIISDLKAQLSKQQQQYAKLEVDFDALETGIEELEMEKEREVLELHQKLKHAQHSTSTIQQQLSTYQRREQELNQIKEENERMHAQIQHNQATHHSVEQQNQELVRSLEELLMRVNNDSFVDRGQVTQSLKEYLTHVATENAEDHFDSLANHLRLNHETV
eukprot:CAMPEP_0117446954 /NCGR_PEP_ID=MMETSP0759-20121206/6618_1 /TAXON_ID=63605 /ORGANISM="Percolomonas cosmopolitus, Strain WS" /LENGTH=518 /DNA_ID=CAMNT_0005239259 /DNA_START=91 /DNA_END=1647 /DNA_ORIENTATION=+